MSIAATDENLNNTLSCASAPFAYTTENFRWYSKDESTLLASLAGGMIVLALCMLAYTALWRVSPFLRRAAFGAAVGLAPGENPVPIMCTWRILAGTGYKDAIDECSHLEDKLFFSFLRMHIDVFLSFSVIALPIMLPMNATIWTDDAPLSSATASPPPSTTLAYGLLQRCSLMHLPPGSYAFLASTFCMYAFTALYLFFLRREWVAYVWRRHNWQLDRQPSVDDFTAIFHLGRSGISAGELEERLRRVVPGEVYAVVSSPACAEPFSRTSEPRAAAKVPIAKRRLVGRSRSLSADLLTVALRSVQPSCWCRPRPRTRASCASLQWYPSRVRITPSRTARSVA